MLSRVHAGLMARPMEGRLRSTFLLASPVLTRTPAKPSHCMASSDAPVASSPPMSLEQACKELDSILKADGEEEAMDPSPRVQSLIEALSPHEVFKAFGNTRQLPKRIYTLDELRLNNVDPTKLLSPKDNSLNFTRDVAQAAAAAGLIAIAVASHADAQQVLGTLFAITFLFVADQVGNYGGGEALIIDTLARVLQPKYKRRVAYHEAGHFLVAYLVGLMPRAYTLSSLDAFTRYKALNIQAGTQFCDSEFTKEMQSGTLKSSSLSQYCCVALAGVVTEYLRFEEAEGGVGDIQQLDALFRSIGFTQMKADSEVRWAVLNDAMILRRHEALHDKVADAMERGASVGELVMLIEGELAGSDDI